LVSVFAFLLALSMSLIFAQDATCYVAERSFCQSQSDTVIAALSDVTNAHGETASSGNYDNVLCCTFSGSLTCNNNKILGLSSTTNAHAEIPTQINYATHVCYSDLSCISTSYACGSEQVPDYPIKTLSLSSATNAHIGVPGSGSVNICCTSETLYPDLPLPNCGDGNLQLGESCDSGLADPFSGSSCGDFDAFTGGNLLCNSLCQIDTIQCTPSNPGVCGDGEVNNGETCDGAELNDLTCNDLGFPGGSLSCVNCQLDTNQCTPGAPSTNVFWSSDGISQISNIEVFVGFTKVKLVIKNLGLSQGTVIEFDIYEDDVILDDSIRTVTAVLDSQGTAIANWTITQSDLDKTLDDYAQFYFIAEGEKSNYLEMDVQDDDLSDVIICNDYNDETLCEEDPVGVAKNSVPTVIDCSDPEIQCTCMWDEDSDSCAGTFTDGIFDEFGNYSKYGTCLISEQESDPNECDDGILILTWDGVWTWASGNPEHKDPKGLALICEAGGTRSIECPAQIQLPFFGIYNIIVAVIIIILIYFILSSKKVKRELRKFIK